MTSRTYFSASCTIFSICTPTGHFEEALYYHQFRFCLPTASRRLRAMCAGATVLARIPRLVFGAFDPKAGACGTLYNIVQDTRLNHRVETVGGILAERCGILLKDFFSKVRGNGMGKPEG